MRLRFLQKTSVLLFFLVCSPCVVAIAQSYSYTKLPLFKEKENIVVKDVDRDAKGFIWFLANGTIYRYNGFTSLNLQESLPKDVSLDDMPQLIYIDNDNRLWISGVNSLSYFDIDTWRLYKIPKEQLPPIKANEVTWIKQDANGQVFVAYFSGHILIVDDKTTRLDDTLYRKSIALGTNIKPRSCTIWKDKLWVGTSIGGLYTLLLNDTQQTNYIQLPGIEGDIGFLFHQENQLVVDVLSDGMYYYDTQSLKLIKKNNPSMKHLMHHGMRENKHFIVHIIDGVVTLFDKKDLRVIAKMPNVLPSEPSDTFDIFLSNNEVLVATAEGILVFYPQIQGAYSLVPDSENKSVRGFYKFPDGSIFYAGYGGYKYIDKTGTLVKLPIYKEVYCILPIDDSRLLLGTEGTFLKVFDRQRLELYDVEYKIADAYKNEFRGNPHEQVKSLAEDDTNYYIGTTKGLWALHKKTHILKPLRDASADSQIQNLFIFNITVDDDILLLSTHIGLLKYSLTTNSWSKIYPQQKIMGVYQHLEVNDTIWLATQASGVVGIDKQGTVLKTIDASHGLSDNLVYSLAVVNEYKVAGTNNGLSIIKGDKIIKPSIRSGVTQNEFNHGATYYDKNTEQLYMGGLNGYTVLDMKTSWFEEQEDSLTMVTNVAITDTKGSTVNIGYAYPYRPESKITLSPQQDVLQIYVGTVTNYKSEQQLRYKLGKDNNNWQEIATGQPISLTGLSPNDYDLFIGTDREIAENKLLTLSIVKEPMFYQTIYFQILIFIFLVFLLWYWFEKKKQKLKKEQEMRTKISADLHDDVGSLLTGISMQVEFLEISSKERSSDSQLKKIGDSCKDAIRAMGDIVWSIDARNDNWESLIAKLRQYAYHLFESSATEFTFDVKGVYTQKFSQQDRQAIYLIVKEALHNSKKHAQATRVDVLFIFTAVQVHIIVKDNGKGFVVEDKKLGQGLKNMKKRTEDIKATIDISASPNGTEIKIHKKIKNYLIR